MGLAISALFRAALITVIQQAMRIDFKQLTDDRVSVSQAVERRFIWLAVILIPEELEPWYLWSAPSQ
jgi:hypothetical protein